MTNILNNNTTYYYRVRVIDENGVIGDWASSSFSIDLSVVTLNSPQGTINDTQPTLDWSDSILPNVAYDVQVSTNTGFSSLVDMANGLSSSTYTLTNILNNNTSYYWRVRVIDENDVIGDWTSSTFSMDLSTVTLNSPSGTINDTQPALDWSDSLLPNVTYDVQVSANSSFSTLVDSANGISSSAYTLTNTLQHNVTYYYRVRVIDQHNVVGDWCSEGNFITDFVGPVVALYDNQLFGTNFTLSGTAIDSNNNVSEVYISVDGGGFGKVNGTTSWNSNLVLNVGTYTVYYYGVDNIGNIGYTNNATNINVEDTLYVASNGMDANLGTKISPLLNIQKAMNKALSLGIRKLYLKEGIYTEGNGLSNAVEGNNYAGLNIVGINDFTISGGWNDDYSGIFGYSTFKIDPLGNIRNGINIDSYSGNIDDPPITNIQLSGLIITGLGDASGEGISIRNSYYSSISNVIVSNNLCTGIGIHFGHNNNLNIQSIDNITHQFAGIFMWYSTSNHIDGIIRNNCASNVSQTAVQGEGGGIGIFASSDSFGGGNIVSANIISNYADYGSAVYILGNVKNTFISDMSYNFGPSIVYASADSGTIFSNCIFSGTNGSTITAIDETGGNGEMQNHSIINCTFVTNTLGLLYNDWDGPDMTHSDWQALNTNNSPYHDAAEAWGNKVTNW